MDPSSHLPLRKKKESRLANTNVTDQRLFDPLFKPPSLRWTAYADIARTLDQPDTQGYGRCLEEEQFQPLTLVHHRVAVWDVISQNTPHLSACVPALLFCFFSRMVMLHADYGRPRYGLGPPGRQCICCFPVITMDVVASITTRTLFD